MKDQELFKTALKMLHLKQREAAAIIDKSLPTVKQYSTGARNVPDVVFKELLKRLAKDYQRQEFINDTAAQMK